MRGKSESATGGESTDGANGDGVSDGVRNDSGGTSDHTSDHNPVGGGGRRSAGRRIDGAARLGPGIGLGLGLGHGQPAPHSVVWE